MDNVEIVKILVGIPQCDLEKFDAVAADRRMNRSTLMRECVLEKIAEHEKNE